MSATGGQVYEILNAATETPPDRIYTLPQNNAHIARMYFYARDNLEMILHDIPTDEKAVIFIQKASLAKTGKDCILREFEDKREGSNTVLVLKKTKTASSCRTIFMT